MIIDEEVYLEHFGVKGMQWGKRRARNRELNKKNTLARYGDKKVKPLTRAQKAARSDRNIHRAKVLGVTALVGSYIALNLLAAHGKSQAEFKYNPHDFKFNAGDFNANRERARRASSAFKGAKTAADIIHSEHAKQSASLLRMHQEGKMDKEQFKNFTKKLDARYARKIMDLG